MRTAAAFFAIISLTVSAPAALRNLERLSFSGSDYVRLAEWAEWDTLARGADFDPS